MTTISSGFFDCLASVNLNGSESDRKGLIHEQVVKRRARSQMANYGSKAFGHNDGVEI